MIDKIRSAVRSSLLKRSGLGGMVGRRASGRVIAVHAAVGAAAVIALAVGAALSFSPPSSTEMRQYYSRTDSSSLSWSASIAENPFYDGTTLGSGQAYVSALVDTIEAQFDYSYASSAVSDLRYTTSVTAEVVASGGDETGTIWRRGYTLLDPVSSDLTASSFSLSLPVSVAPGGYSEVVRSFKESLNVTMTARLIVTFSVVVETEIEGHLIYDDYIHTMSLPPNTDVMLVTGEKTAEVTTPYEQKVTVTREPDKVLGSILALLALLAAACCTVDLLTIDVAVDSPYQAEVKNCIAQCEDRAVSVTQLPDGFARTIPLADFESLLRVSDERSLPVLCHSDSGGETLFCVIDGDICYEYIVKQK